MTSEWIILPTFMQSMPHAMHFCSPFVKGLSQLEFARSVHFYIGNISETNLKVFFSFY